MGKRLCIDVFTEQTKPWMIEYGFRKTRSKYGIYYTVEIDSEKKSKIIRRIKHAGLKYRSYESRWARSSDYRSNFFKRNKGPYRCRYCNKKLNKNMVVVDHLVPIAKVKTRASARNLLFLHGISNVNDYRNLVPSCKKCNLKKSDKMGLWYIKGKLGKYRTYWAIRRLILLCMFLFVIYLCLKWRTIVA